MKARAIEKQEEPTKLGLSGKIDFTSMKKIEKRIITKPTHDVKITTEFGSKLMDICDKSNTHISEADIPSDILFAKTVPMTDFNIEILEPKPSKTIHPTVRVILLDDYQSSIDLIDPNDDTLFTGLGVVMFTYKKPLNISLYVVFGVFPNDEKIFIMNQICLYGCSSVIEYRNKMKRINTLIFSEDQMNMLARSILKMWYGIQVSLLNPVIKEGFHRETHLVEKPTITTNNKKKPPIRYKKVVYLNDEFIDSDEQIKRIFTRKMLCWYVTGHWRNQATNNGHKRIFIQGYWKGVAREMKRSDIREREMILKEE
jgi:hypothetical protein